MMMYHPIKFDCRKINISVNIVETVILDYTSPHCDLKLEDGEPVLLHDTLAHDVASPYQVWSQNVLWFRKYHLDKHSPTFWTFTVTLILTETIQSFHKTIQRMMMCHQTKFSCKRISSPENISHNFDYMFLHCDLDLEAVSYTHLTLPTTASV